MFSNASSISSHQIAIQSRKQESYNSVQETPDPLKQRDEDEWTLDTDSHDKLDADQDLMSPMYEINH